LNILFYEAWKCFALPEIPLSLNAQRNAGLLGEEIMLTRRSFAGFASCAICGITDFIATEAFAQGAQPPAPGGVTRKILSQVDGPVPGSRHRRMRPVLDLAPVRRPPGPIRPIPAL
jgi:hypothetical protein